MELSAARCGRLARQPYLRRLASCLALLIVLPAFAGENVILRSGLRLHVDRHEVSDGLVRLFSGGGVIEVLADAVAGFEQDDYVPPTPPPDASKPAAKADSPKPADPKQLIEAAAARNGIPKKLVQSVAKAESGLDQNAVSPKGAIGVMQLMPGVARSLGADPNDPEQNIEAGTRLLRELLLKYNGDVAKALAAYNAGPTAVDRYHGIPPYPETRHYVKKIVRDYLSSNDQ